MNSSVPMPLNCAVLALPRTWAKACRTLEAGFLTGRMTTSPPGAHFKLNLAVGVQPRLLAHRLRDGDLAFAGDFHDSYL